MAARNPELESTYREYLAALVLFHQAAAHRAGLGATDYQALNLLELRGPQSPGQLSAALGLTTGATTRLVDRLAEAGYVDRGADPSDRRKVTVRLRGVPAGLDQHLAGVRRDIGAYIGGLDQAGLDVLVGYFRVGADAYAAAVAGA